MTTQDSIGIEVNFLTDRYVATWFNDRRNPEWPPHPARLFSALVAVWAENGSHEDERLALEWLEGQDPPRIAASDAVQRSVVSHFVPVNDATVLARTWHQRKAEKVTKAVAQLQKELFAADGEITREAKRLENAIARERRVEPQVSTPGKTPTNAALQMFPERRVKQQRFYPSVTPDVPRVTYVWNARPDDAVGTALDGLLNRVTRLGHTSSLVSCRVTLSPPKPNLRPSKDAGYSIRSVRQGQLAELVRLYDRHRGTKPRTMPYTNVRYATSTASRRRAGRSRPTPRETGSCSNSTTTHERFRPREALRWHGPCVEPCFTMPRIQSRRNSVVTAWTVHPLRYPTSRSYRSLFAGSNTPTGAYSALRSPCPGRYRTRRPKHCTGQSGVGSETQAMRHCG